MVMEGGDNAMVYHYNAGNGELDDSDTGITTPINPKSSAAAAPRHQPRRLLLRSKGPHRPDAPRGHEDRPETSWEKVYAWDVEKSVDKGQPQP